MVLLRLPRQKKLGSIALCGLLFLVVSGLTACGGSSSGEITNIKQSTLPGNYNVTVTAVADGATAGTWDVQLAIIQ
jgi:hypothetical protein